MTDTNECDGCKTKNQTCVTREHQKEAIPKCPCTICLVKTLCLNTCEDYTIFWDNWILYVRRYGYGESPF